MFFTVVHIWIEMHGINLQLSEKRHVHVTYILKVFQYIDIFKLNFLHEKLPLTMKN